MATVLVVDDSQVERQLVAGLLRKHPHIHVQLAADGKQALAQIRRQEPDLVLTDLVMPEMDGLELVSNLRRDYSHIPVILMTAYGNETTAVEALARGATSYVPKSQQADTLLETVQRVLARLQASRVRQRLLHCVTEYQSAFLLDNDPALVAPLVDHVQQQMAGIGLGDANGRVRVGIALEEALLNALYHGNLELGASQVAQASLDGTLPSLVKQRRRRLPYRNRRITVVVHLSRSGVRFVVRDEGPGFNPEAVGCHPPADGFELGRCRGLTLMRNLMDEVAFNSTGNEVTMIKLPERVTDDLVKTITQRQEPGSADRGDLLSELLKHIDKNGGGADPLAVSGPT